MKIEQITSSLLESNVFLLTKENGVLLVDGGVEVDKIKPFVEGKKVEGLLLTHGHFDHATYALDYAKEFGCKIYAAIQIKETLADPKINYSDGKFAVKDFSNFVFVEDGEEVQLGDFVVEPVSTPGHSKCSMCYLVDGHLFAGDTLFAVGMGRTDLVGGNGEELATSLEKIEKISFDNLYSGHGSNSTAKDQQLNIKACKRYLRAMLSKATAEKKDDIENQ